MQEKMLVGRQLVDSPRGEVPAGIKDREYQRFLENLKLTSEDSPIGQVARMALEASTEPRFVEFLNRVMNSRGRDSLAAIAKQCSISLFEFQAFWLAAHTNEAIALATKALPDLTKDLIGDAKSQEFTCPMCDAVGTIEREGKSARICPNCGGAGMVRTVGNKHAREKLLEMTGAIKKEPAVSVNLDMRGLGMQSAAARLQKAVPFDLDGPIDVKPDPQ